MKKTATIYLAIVLAAAAAVACTGKGTRQASDTPVLQPDTAVVLPVKKEKAPAPVTAADITLVKELEYDKYTLEDEYPYKDTVRSFQWDKIKEKLALIENLRKEKSEWYVLQNYKNRNGEAPLVKKYSRGIYKRIIDSLGVERYQSVPLYLPEDTVTPEIYGRDGSLVRYSGKSGSFIKIQPIFSGGEWLIPAKYLKHLPDTAHFGYAIFVDRLNQNIATVERTGKNKWSIRSMNPATTGQKRPPYAQPTPLGMFILQEKKTRMIFLKDGSVETGGFAPYASRFHNGAYIHGVPTNSPATGIIEYSPSLGTTPRSHMCVRNATSHAKFIFDNAPVNECIIFVIE